MIDLLTIKTRNQILALSPTMFEVFTQALLPHFGYKQVRTTPKFGKYHADHGIDIKAVKADSQVYGQCKLLHECHSYKYTPIHFIRELGGCMLRDQISNGVFISTLPYSSTAKNEASKMNIELIDIGIICNAMKLIHGQVTSQRQG